MESTKLHRVSIAAMRVTLAAFIVLSMGIACTPDTTEINDNAIERAKAEFLTAKEANEVVPVAGQTVYVPVYSHIYQQQDRTFDLTTTLSIRNTDADNPIIVHFARYYDSAGKVVRDYVASPLMVPAMATLDYIVGEWDRTGGAGANFLVRWSATKPVTEPVVEAVMIGTSGQQGVSFLSVGRVIDGIAPVPTVEGK